MVALDSPGQIGELVAQESKVPDFGRIAVISPASMHDEVEEMVAAACGPGLLGRGDDRLDAPVSVLTARQAKGLEFDVVFVVEPDLISMEGSHRGTDLYVALTRATRQLTVAWAGSTPKSIDVSA